MHPLRFRPTRVMVSADGHSVSVDRAERMGVFWDIAFVRKDGWSLAAPFRFEKKARALWEGSWVKVINLATGTITYLDRDNPVVCGLDQMTLEEAKSDGFEITQTIFGCWECTSHALKDGYPQVNRNDRRMSAAKFLYEKENGPLPFGTVLRHECDNRLCVNPSHLVPGTHSENVKDRVERRRSARGTSNGRTKINESMVLVIRNATLPISILSRATGLDPKAIRNIKNGKSWSHVRSLSK